MKKLNQNSMPILEKCLENNMALGGMKMSKPVRLYPEPEPIVLNPQFIIIGSGLIGFLFFIVGWTLRSIGI